MLYELRTKVLTLEQMKRIITNSRKMKGFKENSEQSWISTLEKVNLSQLDKYVVESGSSIDLDLLSSNVEEKIQHFSDFRSNFPDIDDVLSLSFQISSCQKNIEKDDYTLCMFMQRPFAFVFSINFGQKSEIYKNRVLKLDFLCRFFECIGLQSGIKVNIKENTEKIWYDKKLFVELEWFNNKVVENIFKDSDKLAFKTEYCGNTMWGLKIFCRRNNSQFKCIYPVLQLLDYQNKYVNPELSLTFKKESLPVIRSELEKHNLTECEKITFHQYSHLLLNDMEKTISENVPFYMLAYYLKPPKMPDILTYITHDNGKFNMIFKADCGKEDQTKMLYQLISDLAGGDGIIEHL